MPCFLAGESQDGLVVPRVASMRLTDSDSPCNSPNTVEESSLFFFSQLALLLLFEKYDDPTNAAAEAPAAMDTTGDRKMLRNMVEMVSNSLIMSTCSVEYTQ
jgi:hypothetical protein